MSERALRAPHVFSDMRLDLQQAGKRSGYIVAAHNPFGAPCHDIRSAAEKISALREIEWVRLVSPDVNMLVHVNVNVPEKVGSHALKANFRKHGTNPCEQKLSKLCLQPG